MPEHTIRGSASPASMFSTYSESALGWLVTLNILATLRSSAAATSLAKRGFCVLFWVFEVFVISILGNNTDAFPKTSPDRKSTRLNSSHVRISYAVFCLKKKKTTALMSFWNSRDFALPDSLRDDRLSTPRNVPARRSALITDTTSASLHHTHHSTHNRAT